MLSLLDKTVTWELKYTKRHFFYGCVHFYFHRSIFFLHVIEIAFPLQQQQHFPNA